MANALSLDSTTDTSKKTCFDISCNLKLSESSLTEVKMDIHFLQQKFELWTLFAWSEEWQKKAA